MDPTQVGAPPGAAAARERWIVDMIQKLGRASHKQPTAAAIPYDTATSGMTATDVQAAIDELDAAIAALVIPAAASEAEMEAASSTSVYVSPGRQHRHPSACKAWICLTGTGTIANRASYNISGVVDNGTGNYSATIDTDFSASGNFAVVGSCDQITANCNPSGTGTMTMLSRNTTGALVDAGTISAAAFGDQ